MAPKTVMVDLGGGVKMEFVLIPRGKFMMGSPKTEKERNPFEKKFDDEAQHEVEITKPFYLAKYPVTQEQYVAIIGEEPQLDSADRMAKEADEVKDLDTKQFPVDWVSWSDAQAFCKKLRENDKQKRKFRLPTEAEWEYACRAGTSTPFSFGSELNGKQANCIGIGPYGTTDKGPYKRRTTKVGEYGENKWGLCDMHGNVYQWCEDYYGPYEESESCQAIPCDQRSKHSTEEYRHPARRLLVQTPPRTVAAACRITVTARPGSRNSNWGFRVALRLD